MKFLIIILYKRCLYSLCFQSYNCIFLLTATIPNSLPFNAPNAFLSTPTFTKYLLGEKKTSVWA